jgi:hypothetical protein
MTRFRYGFTIKGVAGLGSSQSQFSPKTRGRPKQSDIDVSKSCARTAQKQKELGASKRLVLNEKGGAAYVVCASARPPRGTTGQLPPLSTKGSNSGHQSSSSSGAAKRLVLKEKGGAEYVAGASARPPRGKPIQLLPLSTEGRNSDRQSSSSGTANAHVLYESSFCLRGNGRNSLAA